MSDYICGLRNELEVKYQCCCKHFGTEKIEKIIDGELALCGEVEIFQLEGHPKALLAYGWGWKEEGIDEVKYIEILKIPPIESALDAVIVAIDIGQFEG